MTTRTNPRIEEVTVFVEDPTSTEDITIFNSGDPKEIVEVQGVLFGGSITTVTIDIVHANDRSVAGTSVLSAATAITSTTTGTVATLSATLANRVIARDDWVRLKTSLGGGVGTLAVTIKYRWIYG